MVRLRPKHRLAGLVERGEVLPHKAHSFVDFGQRQAGSLYVSLNSISFYFVGAIPNHLSVKASSFDMKEDHAG